MKQVSFIMCFFLLTACGQVKRLTGSKFNGSTYVLTIQSEGPKRDSALIKGAIRVVDSGSVENRASRGLRIIKLDTSGYEQIIRPDIEGRFSCKVGPGKYYLFFAGVGFGKMKTGEFKVKGGQSAILAAVLHPEVEPVCDYEIQTPYKTVPRKLP